MANRAEEEWSVNNPRVYFARCTFLHTIGNLYVCSFFFRVDLAKKFCLPPFVQIAVSVILVFPANKRVKCVELFKIYTFSRCQSKHSSSFVLTNYFFMDWFFAIKCITEMVIYRLWMHSWENLQCIWHNCRIEW